MSSATKSIYDRLATGSISYPSILVSDKEFCSHGNKLQASLIGQAFIITHGGLACETVSDGELIPITVYIKSSISCRCKYSYDGNAHNLLNINNCLFIAYNTATYLKLALLEGASFHSLANVLWDTIHFSSNLSIPYSKDYFKKLIRNGIKGFLRLTLPSDKQFEHLLSCPIDECSALVFDGTAVGPKTTMIKPEEQYEPKKIDHNGRVKVVGSRLDRQVVPDSKARGYLDLLSGIERGFGTKEKKMLKTADFEVLHHLLSESSDLEKEIANFLATVVTFSKGHVLIPDYLKTFINEISLPYTSANGFIQLPSPRARNLFSLVSNMTENVQQSPKLLDEFQTVCPLLCEVLRSIPPCCEKAFKGVQRIAPTLPRDV